jgi:hypothetical protein
MHRLKIILCLPVLYIGSVLAADQINFDTSSIPDSLKREALGVVRFSKTEFEYKSEKSGIERKEIVLTVLNKKGKDLADFYYPGDKFHELKSFTGKLYDAKGVLLRKYKMSEVATTEWSSNLASDDKYYGLSCEAPSFPFTIVYEYEISWKNGILQFPVFCPQNSSNLSVEHASYRLLLPENLEFESKAFNLAKEPKKSTAKESTVYEWEVNNLNAIEYESFDPNFEKYVPILYVNPKHFIYDGISGEITNWESMGKWVYELMRGRDILSEDFKKKIMSLTENAKSDREKVKILYDYLGETTRYVSIQLGIGGYQPMEASEVCRTGFGDCKGLSNYMKAMLSVVGIPSNYCSISTYPVNKTLFPDYANFVQMNHAILQVPLPNDTLWLECTNPRVPFGFVHNGISGHDALVYTEQGGKVCRLPDYPDSLNIEKNDVKIELNSDGSAKVSMQKECKIKIFDNYYGFPLATPSEQADDLRKSINLPNVSMGTIQIKEDKSPLPSMDIIYSWTTSGYGSQTGNRLFIPVNPLRSTYEWIKKSKRVHDMEISNGSKNIDSIYIALPEGYDVESMPASSMEKTAFGTVQSSIEKSGKGILIKQSVFIPAGKYSVSTYSAFVAFFDKISIVYNGKIILKKRMS